MPSRRSHTKSHHGCLQCKQRRVKCDETTPQCQRCSRRQMSCSFTEQAPGTSRGTSADSVSEQQGFQLAPSAIHTSQAGSNAPTPGSNGRIPSPIPTGLTIPLQTFTHLDLELIHYYSTQTYMTMTSKLTAHLVWRDFVFEQGLKHNFLLHALMATAALHKATNHAETSETHAAYIKVAFSYQNAALAGYIPALSRPTEDNAIALFILSALLTLWLFGSKKLPEALNGVKSTNTPNVLPQIVKMSENEPTEFVEILTFVQGINAVVSQTAHWLHGTKIEALMKPPAYSELPKNPPDLEASFLKLRQRIEDVRNGATGLSEAIAKLRAETYSERLETLRTVARARTILEHDQQVFGWPVLSDSLYIELVRQRDDLAIALFIHWAACLRCLDHLWWAKGWSYRLVKAASPLLDETWAEVLTWPRKEAGLD